MGLFGGSSSASSSSTNNSSIWDSAEIQSLVESMGYNINYDNEYLAPMNSDMQNFLNYELNPQRFNTAKALGTKAGNVWNTATSDFNKLKGITGSDLLSAFEGGTNKLYSAASGFMDQQDQAIEDNVMTSMGSDLAQNATTMNAGGAVAGSSALNSTAMGIKSGGAQSMESQESKVAENILSAAARTTGKGISSGIRGASSVVRSEFGMAGNLAKAGAKSGGKAASNYWDAALVNQAYTQKQANVNRKNWMINNNSTLMTNAAELMAFLESGSAATTSTTTGSSTVSGGGLL